MTGAYLQHRAVVSDDGLTVLVLTVEGFRGPQHPDKATS